MAIRFRVYDITARRGRYDYLYPVEGAEFGPRRQVLDGTRLGDAWRPPAATKLPRGLQPFDVGRYFGPDGLVVTERARSLLHEHLEHDGVELLPIECEGICYWVVNVLDVVDCLDLSRSVYPADRPWAIEQWVFQPDRFRRSLFKLPLLPTGHHFVVEDEEHPERSFKAAVEQHGLVGIGFKLIWEGHVEVVTGHPMP